MGLAACGDMNRFQTAVAPSATPAKPNRAIVPTQAAEREHERILSSYGGAYDDPKLEALVSKTVDRLVAASDRPDQAYKVTILNSGAVNAFALPTGQLHVTRGLIALASDTSELSSVLSHEMAHVLSKHAAMREDQARQAAIVARVVSDMSNDPEVTAFTLAKSKLTMANFSRDQEMQADQLGVQYAAKTGYQPEALSQSMLVLRQQGHHRSYDGLVLLGWSNFGPRLGAEWNAERSRVAAELAPEVEGVARSECEKVLGLQHERFEPLLDRWSTTPTPAVRDLFYGEGVPDEVVTAVETRKRPRPRAGAIRFGALFDDIVAAEARSVDVPVFLGFAERDVSPDPRDELGMYARCPDLTLHLLPHSGHCHNFAPTRLQQWDRIAGWLSCVSR